MTEIDGWNYDARNVPEGDARKIVTLEEGGMTWIGIRAFHHESRRWLNNGEPERATVKAWRDMPDIARGFYDRGQLVILPARTPTRTPSTDRRDVIEECAQVALKEANAIPYLVSTAEKRGGLEPTLHLILKGVAAEIRALSPTLDAPEK